MIGSGGTLNVEVRTLKNTQMLILNPLKIPKLQFWGLFWGKWLPFSKSFPEDTKNTKPKFYILKDDEHTYHFTMEVTPREWTKDT